LTTVRGLVKVLKDQMEDKIHMTIDSSDDIMQWLVRYAAMLYSRYKTGADGKTAYQRQRGKPCRMEVVPFGETVMYNKLKESGQRKNILDSDWEEGLWLGHARTSNEVLIGTTEGGSKREMVWSKHKRDEGYASKTRPLTCLGVKPYQD
jgi:hypothetical protein